MKTQHCFLSALAFSVSELFLTNILSIIVVDTRHLRGRFEGNTEGKAAVFGLFHTAGLKLPAGPGNPFLRFLQRLGHTLDNGGRSFSREEDIPSWWTSKSRGADPTDSPL